MCKITLIEGRLVRGVFNGECGTVRMTIRPSGLDGALEAHGGASSRRVCTCG